MRSERLDALVDAALVAQGDAAFVPRRGPGPPSAREVAEQVAEIDFDGVVGRRHLGCVSSGGGAPACDGGVRDEPDLAIVLEDCGVEGRP